MGSRNQAYSRLLRPFAAATYVLLYVVSGISLGLLLMALNRYLTLCAVLLLLAVVTTNHLAVYLLFHLRVVDAGSR